MNNEIVLLISEHCVSCSKAISQLERIQKNNPNLTTKIMDIYNYSDKKIFITPAWILNGDLLSYGLIDEKNINNKLI